MLDNNRSPEAAGGCAGCEGQPAGCIVKAGNHRAVIAAVEGYAVHSPFQFHHFTFPFREGQQGDPAARSFSFLSAIRSRRIVFAIVILFAPFLCFIL